MPPDGHPVVCFFPARNEIATVAAVVGRVPEQVCGRPVVTIVVDDGSTDGTGDAARGAGARVVRHDVGLGLGAAVRRGLAEGVVLDAAAIAFCDADGEYAPEELETLVRPILDGGADYVAGSRFAHANPMHLHRRAGNRALTFALRAVSGAAVTDGQSGYRALSLAAARHAEIAHDYNYAQVLTLDLLGKGFRYAEVPISYAPRVHGRSFVRVLPYLAHVVPAMLRAKRGSEQRALILDDVIAEPVARV
jgi:glycosyltransferase involved in cell wall biosynthesis